MRIEVSSRSVDLSPVLRHYAEGRVWVALQHAARRPSWVGMRFTGGAGIDSPGRMSCQMDAWLRGVGLVTARYSDTNPYLAIDCAAVLLGQAVARRLRKAGVRPSPEVQRAAPGGLVGSPRASTATPPRLAVVVRPSGARSRLSIRPWLRARYGVDEVQTITLSRGAWSELASGGGWSAESNLKDRLALSLLSRPEVIVVLGDRSSASSAPRVSREDVERVIGRIRPLVHVIEVVGVWLDEQWDAVASSVELVEVGTGLKAEGGGRTDGGGGGQSVSHGPPPADGKARLGRRWRALPA